MSRRKYEEEEGNIMWNQLRKFVTLIDELRDLGLQEFIKLPRIATCGTQSAGKSSLLEFIVGLDFLPRGEGVVTRRPLELRLVHTPENTAPSACFEEIPGVTFKDFKEVKQKIAELTDKNAGTKKNIRDTPIVLTVKSHTCPDLTIIDLPGITRIPVKDSDQHANIEEITKGIIRKYCEDSRTIILCVIPANADLATSDALKFSQELDPHGLRTIGVITKIDIMDRGTNARKVLLGEEIPLRLGYIGIKNRSQQDIFDNISVKKALENEKEFFRFDPSYSNISKEYLGTEALVTKLTRIMYAHIRFNLSNIVKEVEEKIKEVKGRLEEIGPPLPTTINEKMLHINGLMKRLCGKFRGILSGKFEAVIGKIKITGELSGGAKIKHIFYELLGNEVNYSVSQKIKDSELEKIIKAHEGINMPGFPSQEIFPHLIIPEIQKLIEPTMQCLGQVYEEIEEILTETGNDTFDKCQEVGEIIMDSAVQLIKQSREKTSDILQSFLDSQKLYMFSNDEQYLSLAIDNLKGKPAKNEKEEITPIQIYVASIKMKLDTYYRVIVKNIRDVAPKIIGFNMLKTLQQNIETDLFSLVARNERIHTLLIEPIHVAEERKTLNKTHEILKKSFTMLTKDSDLVMTNNNEDDQLLMELQRYQVFIISNKKNLKYIQIRRNQLVKISNTKIFLNQAHKIIINNLPILFL